MTGCLATLGLIAIACWAAGSLVLRWTGILLAVTGLSAALTTSAGFATAVLGAALWLIGHALYRARHEHWRSPLARQITHGLSRRDRSAHEHPPVSTRERCRSATPSPRDTEPRS